MVKKIDSTSRPPVGQSAPVEAGKAVATAKVGSVGQVAPTQAQAPASGIRRPTRAMSAAEREHLLRLLHEEADKMFGDSGLPQEKREKVEKAVQMAIDSSILDTDKEEKK